MAYGIVCEVNLNQKHSKGLVVLFIKKITNVCKIHMQQNAMEAQKP